MASRSGRRRKAGSPPPEPKEKKATTVSWIDEAKAEMKKRGGVTLLALPSFEAERAAIPEADDDTGPLIREIMKDIEDYDYHNQLLVYGAYYLLVDEGVKPHTAAEFGNAAKCRGIIDGLMRKCFKLANVVRFAKIEKPIDQTTSNMILSVGEGANDMYEVMDTADRVNAAESARAELRQIAERVIKLSVALREYDPKKAEMPHVTHPLHACPLYAQTGSVRNCDVCKFNSWTGTYLCSVHKWDLCQTCLINSRVTEAKEAPAVPAVPAVPAKRPPPSSSRGGAKMFHPTNGRQLFEASPATDVSSLDVSVTPAVSAAIRDSITKVADEWGMSVASLVAIATS